MNVRAASSTLAAAVASVVLTLVVTDTWAMHPWWVVVPGLTVLAVVVGVRRHRPARRLPWRILLGALVLLWVGWTMSAWIGSGVWHVAPEGVVALVRDLIYVVAYPMLGVASVVMVRARTGGRDRDNVIDALIVMVALATTLGAWLFGTTSLTASSTDRLWVHVSPLLLAAVVTASIRLLMADAIRIPAAWLLFVSSGLTLAGNLWTAQLLRNGLPTQHTTIDVLWVLGFVVLGAAVLHPSMRELTEPVPPDHLVQGMPVDRLALLGAALLSAPLAHLRMSGAGPTETLQVVVGGILVAVLAVWRVSRLLRERDDARHAVAEGGVRDATVATVGRWALGDRSTRELLVDVEAVLGSALPDASCSVRPMLEDDDVSMSVPPVEGDPTHLVRPIDDGDRTIAHVTARFGDDRRDLGNEEVFLDAVASVLSAAARRRADEARLRHDALHDSLTGLPNRTLAIDRLALQLERRDAAVSVIFLDLDGFKTVNDTLGHEAGDALLRDMATRLRQVVRRDDTVARFAGDEFLVIADDVDRGVLADLVDRVLEAVTIDVPGDGHTLPVSASVGVATGRSGTVDVDVLLQQADAAMYRAKHTGGRHAVWADDHPALVVTR